MISPCSETFVSGVTQVLGAASIVFLDTEFTSLTPGMELLSLAMVCADGMLEFYGERSDVPTEQCSRFVQNTVLLMMNGRLPVATDLPGLRARVLTFTEQLPARSIIACESWRNIDLLTRLIGETWPEQIDPQPLDLAPLTAIRIFWDAQQDHYDAGHPSHHALSDAHALHAGYMAWLWAHRQ